MKTKLPLIAWGLMMVAAIAMLGVQWASVLPVSTVASSVSGPIIAPALETPTLMIVLMASFTPRPTTTPWPPTPLPAPTQTPWPQCPQPSGKCVWPWPTDTPIPPVTTTPYPVCDIPDPGIKCMIGTVTATALATRTGD